MVIPSLAIQLTKQLCVFDYKADSKSNLVKKTHSMVAFAAYLFCEDFCL